MQPDVGMFTFDLHLQPQSGHVDGYISRWHDPAIACDVVKTDS